MNRLSGRNLRYAVIRWLPNRDSSPRGNVDDARPDGGRVDDAGTDHLKEVPDGAGCTEIWEYLSERDAGREE